MPYRRRRQTIAPALARRSQFPRNNISLKPETQKALAIIILLIVFLIVSLSLGKAAGFAGERVSAWLQYAFGNSSYLLPIFLTLCVIVFFKANPPRPPTAEILSLVLFLLSLLTLSGLSQNGGAFGNFLAGNLAQYITEFASYPILTVLLVGSVFLSLNLEISLLYNLAKWIIRNVKNILLALLRLLKFGKKVALNVEMPSFSSRGIADSETETDAEEKKYAASYFNAFKKDEKKKILGSKKRAGIKFEIPLSLLSDTAEEPTSGDIKSNQEKIAKALENFGIEVEMGSVNVGPTVTQYTLKPAEGVKLSKIVALQNDLALALAAHPLRIEAPIPGKALVGIEVPNQTAATVTVKELLAHPAFKNRATNVTIPLGKDVAGNPYYTDIGAMPHLLIAGATGSGKSVSINNIIVSLIYQNSPDNLKFILVDPKRVEMNLYNGIPYLLTPVIHDVKKTISALRWTVSEMERRYHLLDSAKKRNFDAYNQSAEETIPYIMFIIDELASLMSTAPQEVEAVIVRLAQQSRAVGIHLILATQRPSVNVITGLIKANIPSRIAFHIPSIVDSRTILDTGGAEKLLGRGDMLFVNLELSKPKRLQGAYLTDGEIERVTDFLRDLGRAEYDDQLAYTPDHVQISQLDREGDGSRGDDLFDQAREVVLQARKASASLLQRRLSVGYARAARLLDLLEGQGIIGPQEGSKPREILIGKNENEEYMGEEGVQDSPDAGGEAEGDQRGF